jgi:hypothetical protein
LTRIANPVSAAVLVTTIVLFLGTGAVGAAPQQAEPLSVRTSIPAAVQFGDALTARVVVLMDRSAVDSRRLRVVDALAPLTLLAPQRVSRFSRGPLEVVSIDLTAACIDQRCVPRGGSRAVRLPAVRAEAPGRDGTLVSATRAWPELEVRGRVSTADLARPRLPFRTDLDPPSASYRVSPPTLAALLDVVAVLLALAAVVLAGLQVAAILRRRRLVQLTDFERALALARGAETRSPGDRRRALELLARLLRPREERLAHAASDLAWSAPEPTPDSLSSLVDEVAQEVSAK